MPGLKVPFQLKTYLSRYNSVTVFLAPAVMEVLEEKLLKELSEDAMVVVCRFSFPHWPHTCSKGAGLDQVWAYVVTTVHKPYPSVSQ
ncbi:ATP synthase subunit C lysine N-methyltransferase-like [Oncorhynchus tshawytscha]|uniref:ATP synthase subunit C lysine N-methyltransferase-like n=1 Tax=Oncorhynchus tshawytscha TaxID=74940 RepID=UPI000D09FCCB|nr:ATP synthase subunit C lysine N-methyltransferase-like [Oncorhynchus tshawytscha]